MFRPKAIDFQKTKTFPTASRHNLVRIDTLQTPGVTPVEPFKSGELDLLAQKISQAREANAPVIFFMGAHVIKCGLSRYLIDLMRDGFITHIASNGAGSIHDFELAYLGGTSEDVPSAIQDGSFGMWEETGRWMNEAVQAGYRQGLGYGQSLAEYVEKHQDRFPYLADCLFYQAWQMGVPATYHITIGTDIIHQHPTADFAALGGASGIDFAVFCAAVSGLDGGVHMNVGSAVTGPEVFLKALSIARNQGYPASRITTANFDLLDLGEYHASVGQDQYNYYYRPLKNVISRPTASGGTGLYIRGNHMLTVPALWQRLKGMI